MIAARASVSIGLVVVALGATIAAGYFLAWTFGPGIVLRWRRRKVDRK